MASKFGGIEIKEQAPRSKFGGVAVQAPASKFGGVPVAPTPLPAATAPAGPAPAQAVASAPVIPSAPASPVAAAPLPQAQPSQPAFQTTAPQAAPLAQPAPPAAPPAAPRFGQPGYNPLLHGGASRKRLVDLRIAALLESKIIATRGRPLCRKFALANPLPPRKRKRRSIR
jgi:hypothetical protein